jgi:hypothetical protein
VVPPTFTVLVTASLLLTVMAVPYSLDVTPVRPTHRIAIVI